MGILAKLFRGFGHDEEVLVIGVESMEVYEFSNWCWGNCVVFVLGHRILENNKF